MATETQRVVNRGSARIIPLLLIAIVSYSSWALVNLCVTYLFNPKPTDHVRRRHGAGIAIIVVYFTLLLPMAMSYFRVLHVIFTDPGYVALGRRSEKRSEESRFLKARREGHTVTAVCEPLRIPEKPTDDSRHEANGASLGETLRRTTLLDRKGLFEGTTPAPAGLEEFHTKDVFICDIDGLPIWCSICENWKADRVHHCSEIDRCVRNMDHYCPWVGGIVSETSYKFFIQFVSYAALYCVFTLISMAYFVAEARRLTSSVNTHWVAVLAFASLFTLFCVGMSATSVQLVLLNSTTVENLSRRSKIYNLAILIYEGNPPPPLPRLRASNINPDTVIPEPVPYFPTITYPLPSSSDQNQDLSVSNASPQSFLATSIPQRPSPSVRSRTFAILKTLPGESPWDLGPSENFKQVMGHRWYDWFLPLRRSPWCDHSRGDSMYLMDEAVIERMKRDAQILPRPGVAMERHVDRRNRRGGRRRQLGSDGVGGEAEEHVAVGQEGSGEDVRARRKRRRKRRRLEREEAE